MTEKVINELPEILKSHICTMKKASFDESKALNMSESLLKVVNFDKIPNEYSRGRGWSGVPASNDALYITEDEKWYFVEFKNGSIDKADLFRKIYDSLIMLIDLGIIPDFLFVRSHLYYILVYNSDKYSQIPKAQSRDANYAYIHRLAQKEEKLFDVEKLEQYLFKETHTYSKELFQSEFIVHMERQEQMAAV